ncbi:DUF4335 domain-containing protein [Chamaesiphon minutus]|uniref:DUF4335 domain-containing protein n=1 Tax=Chamaesiphon minutus (strain ATCC 27169 / PCC 6605) TaxID=1173020 RepID=K9ULZ7_CHAP6|nr:DUF4335 domain-containing protein [Chamaesiphon minutus]AFY95820.1 hypothetical protein Cha6605_4910 [Chamaesiphon minutus PCC 6605]
MTIRRQYSLPNCTLVLDGLSDGSSTTGIPDSRPVMSSLFNAECHFVGCDRPLFGGRDFLTSLVTTVSNYAQEFLSGIPHPKQPDADKSIVSLVKGDRENIHHLEAKLESDPAGADAASGKPARVNLSTIQLFDLLEAVDQFLADKRTLPDIMIPLQPVSKSVAQPISAQAVPVGLGLASLVVASLVGYALPVPEVTAPKSTQRAPLVQPNPTPTSVPGAPPNNTPQSSTSPVPSPVSALPSKSNTLVEATQIGFLERKLQRDLSKNWQERGQIKQAASFNVKVNQDGQIVNYQVVGQTDAEQSKLTPLPKLATNNNDTNQAIGNFSVVFNPTGLLEVKPTDSLQGLKSFGKPITEPKLQTDLATQLRTTLQKSLPGGKPIDAQNLNYRVAVTKTGEIVDYEPIDRLAADLEAKTPLPKLTTFNAQAAISQEPLAQYQVIFQPDGKILVTPK